MSRIRSHNVDPQALISQIVRDRVYSCRYWKEHCFALNAETILERARDLDHVGFLYGGLNRPSPFLCLLIKLLQIQPDLEVVETYINLAESEPSNDPEDQLSDFRYLRALAAAYIRLVGNAIAVHSMMDPLYSDRRQLVVLNPSAQWEIICMDEWADQLTGNGAVYGFHFPYLTNRHQLELRGEITEYQCKVQIDED
jgi:pre-mRNA-splicing factor 38A